MALTCGFFNSMDHDRRYDARQFSRLFDGIINDGIFMNIGDCFVVTAANSQVKIGTGRAWFNGTWSHNDAIYLMDLPLSNVAYPRIDAVVLEVNATDEIRNNSFKIVEGTAATNPQNPPLINTERIHQHVLCYITRKANKENITQADVRNMIGSDETPFVTGILETVSLTQLLGQWESELDEFVDGKEKSFDEWSSKKELEFTQWSAAQVDEFERWMREQKADFDTWTDDRQEDFDAMLETSEGLLQDWKNMLDSMFAEWFAGIKTELSGDVAGNLQIQIDSDEIKRILTAGFPDGVKTISEDGKEIKTVASDGRVLTKTFNDGFNVLTTVLTARDGGTIATQVKEFDSSGRTVVAEATYI